MAINKLQTSTTLLNWMNTINSIIDSDSNKLGKTENAVSASKLKTARKISVGTGVTSTATSFDGSSDISIPVTGIYGSYLTWGGKNISGDISPLDAACLDEFGHNALAFLPGSCIKIERSTDGGTTFTEVTGYSDTDKMALVTSQYGIAVATGVSANGGTLTNTNASKYKLRITISTRDSNRNTTLYLALKNIIIYFSTNGATGNTCLIERRTIANYNNSVNTWTTQGTYPVSGWSGWNSIPWTGGSFGGGRNQTGQIADMRLTFGFTGVDTKQGSVPSVIAIRFIATTRWQSPSTMATSGHLYTYDMSKNATFPAKVIASSFTGNLTGNADTATTATYLKGFKADDNPNWGNTTGTLVTSMMTANAGSLQFRENAGKVYLKIDGKIYQNEGTYEVIDTNSITDYAPTKTGTGASGTWGISISGNAATATKLATARTLQTNLASTTAASFDGTGNVSIGVKGILPLANGGTGQSTANAAANAFINSLTTGEDAPTDNDYCLFQYKNGGTTTTTFHRKKTSVIWSYVNSKISSVLGLTASSYGGNSATASKLATGRTITLTGDVTGSTTFDGSSNVSITTTVGDNSHSHSNYLPLAGGTMTGTITTPENTKPAIKFRNSTSYASTINYDTSGNEALAVNLQNALTSFMVNTGVDGTTWTAAGKWNTVKPALQVKKNSVYINELIPSGTDPAYTLNVNGNTNIKGTIKFGDCVMEYDSTNKCVNFVFE